MFYKRTAIFLLAICLGSLHAQETPTVAPVTFSLSDQTFFGSLTLELHCETTGVEIRYSTNGQYPSIFNSTLYTGPMEITDTTWIRAQARLPQSADTSLVSSGHYIRLGNDVVEFESPLPILLLENFGQGDIPAKTWNQTGEGVQQLARQRAQWLLFDGISNDETSRLASLPQESARLGIRGRGAYSSSFPRKPFSVEAWNEDDQPQNIAPLGMPAESDWVLYSPNQERDSTLLFNTWLYALSRSLGGNAMRFRFTEAFIHTDGGPLTMEDHAGIYVIIEKVKRDRNRIDFPALSEDGTAGGWLLSINRMDPIPVGGYPTANGATSPQFFHTAGPDGILQTEANQAGLGDDIPRQHNAFINFESPNGYVINQAQRAAIEGWFATFEQTLYGNSFRDPNTGYRRYLDVDNFIDYFILHDITRNTDGLLLSMWVYKEGPSDKLKMGPVWDYDLAYKRTASSDIGINKDRLWYGRLWQDPDFQQAYQDRWQALREGRMSDEVIHNSIDAQAAEITDAAAQRHGINDWPNRLTNWKAWITDRAATIDDQFESLPTANLSSGQITAGTIILLKAGSIFSPRTIYFTTDGSDPRLPGGEVAPEARLFEKAWPLETTTNLRARVLHEGRWSGLLERRYFVNEAPASSANLVISKIHYHPTAPTETERAAGFLDQDEFEFIELQNRSSQALNLAGTRFTDGIAFEFSDQTLAPNGRLLIARHREALIQRYGDTLPVIGDYTGNLRNSGERLQLLDFRGELLAEVDYDDEAPWPEAADGDGPSLVHIHGAYDSPFSWRPSLTANGSPGSDDRPPRQGDLLTYATGTATPRILVEDQGTNLTIRYPRNLATKDIQMSFESSKDLFNWQETPVTSKDRVYFDLGLAEEWAILPKDENHRFLRLRVESP